MFENVFIFMMLKKSKVTSLKKWNFNTLMKVYLFFFRMIGIVPFEGKSFKFIGSSILIIFFAISNATHCAMFAGYGFNNAKQGFVELDYICETVPLIGLTIKHIILLSKRSECLILISNCRKLWNELRDDDERQTVQFFERKMRKLFNFLLVTCILLNVFYSYTAISLSKLPLNENNETHRYLPYRWFVYEVTNSPAYELIFALQVILLNNAGIITMAIETISPFLIMMSCGYLKVLQNRLNIISKKCERITDEELYSELISCARFHRRILSECTKIRKLVRTLFLIQLMCTAYNISLVGIKLAGKDPDRYKFTSTFAFCLLQLFLCQWPPDILLGESEKVSTAAYLAYSSTTSSRTGKLLLGLIQRAQRPEEITAGGMIKLSLGTFKSMLTSAMSFFTVLRKFHA